MTDPNKDMRQDRRKDGLNTSTDALNRANQEAASRPPVDAEHGLDDRGHMVANPREGSAFEPLRQGSDADRAQRESGDYVIGQGAEDRSGDAHMTSRQGAMTQHGDAIRESQSAPGGGSVFQPLEADPRHLEDRAAIQQGNPAGQNQQGLDGGDDRARGTRAEGAREGVPRDSARRDDGMPRRD